MNSFSAAFHQFWTTLNDNTNNIAIGLVGAGVVLIVRGHAAEGTAVLTGAFGLLQNGKKSSPPPA